MPRAVGAPTASEILSAGDRAAVVHPLERARSYRDAALSPARAATVLKRGALPAIISTQTRTRPRCFRCLALDHQVRDCRDPIRCKACKRFGHRLLDGRCGRSPRSLFSPSPVVNLIPPFPPRCSSMASSSALLRSRIRSRSPSSPSPPRVPAPGVRTPVAGTLPRPPTTGLTAGRRPWGRPCAARRLS